MAGLCLLDGRRWISRDLQTRRRILHRRNWPLAGLTLVCAASFAVQAIAADAALAPVPPPVSQAPATSAPAANPVSPEAPEASEAKLEPQTEDQRDQLFREISEEVAALEKQGNLLKKVVRAVTPSVVHIETVKRTQVSYTRRTREEAGSGVIIKMRSQTYVLTNRHVVDEAVAGDINIRLADGRVLHPEEISSDRRTDVAVLKVTAADLIPAHLGNSKNIEIGDFVLAVGSPFGLSHSVTYGIISATGRRNLDLGDGSIRSQDFFQTDAAINPGNSGGPLLNLRGEVIGINTAIASSSGGSEGIGFTIPINMALTVAQQLVDQGHASRSYLGVRLNDRFGQAEAAQLGMARPQGAMVTGVTPNTPAAKADLQPGDVVLEFDGREIEDDQHLIQVVGYTGVGKEVEMIVLRAGKKIRLRIVLEDRSRFESDG